MSEASELQNEPVLKRFRAAVAEVYGDRLERVVLYGSRAGGHQPDSDHDIAVFIKDPGSFYGESGRLAAITTDILEDTGAVISTTPFPAGAHRERSGLMHELQGRPRSVKPETADYLAKARTTLARCSKDCNLALPHVAAREACDAAFHAAEAYIFEHTGKVATTHRGVRSEFARLVRREPRIDRELTRFLATAYQLKAAADYGIGPTAAPITADQAAAAITPAGRFIACIAALLP